MAKIIAITGNSGSGKSVLSCILASQLAKKDEVILINNSSTIPMHPVWQPSEKTQREKSLGNILSAPSVNAAQIGKAVVMVKGQKDLGLLGYTAGDTPLSYIDSSYSKSLNFLKAAAQLTDGYLLIDCCADFADPLRPAALELADAMFLLLTPDLRGLQYYNGQKTLLESNAVFRFHQIRCIAGGVKKYHPVSTMHDELDDGFWGVLDFSPDLEQAALQGDLFHAWRFCPNGYQRTVRNMMDVISNG